MSNEKIYTIRISEAMEKKCGCPLCEMQKELEKDETERILGASMMEPDVRKATNEQGFCTRHLESLLAKPSRLSLALILQTHTDELSKKLFSPAPFKKTPDPKKQIQLMEKREKSCYLCGRINRFMTAACAAFAYMYKSMPDFEGKIKEQPCFCLKHLHMLLEAGQSELSKDAYRAFADTLNAVTGKYMQKLSGDIDWFCKKFDYRYKDADWKDSKDAVERAVNLLKE